MFKVVKLSLFILISIFFIFISLEVPLRCFFLFKNLLISSGRNFSEYLGWETKAYDKWRRDLLDSYGLVKYSTTKYGFRVYGNPTTKKTKIFVIGDSFTQACQVSDGETYYDYLRNHNKNIEIFAYGCSGYGSLQEYMILDKYFDLIKPDLILIQFCDNDFINNYHPLESASLLTNNHMTRPYLINGKIEWLYPVPLEGVSYQLIQYSYLLRLLEQRFNILSGCRFCWPEPPLTPNNPMFGKSMIVTRRIFEMMQKRAGHAPIIAFSSPGFFPQICRSLKICYIPEVTDQIEKNKNLGIRVDGTPYDGHWNKTGHAIAGKVILNYLKSKGFINKN